MPNYSSLLLTSVLLTGVAVSVPQMGVRAGTLHQPSLEPHLLAQESSKKGECPQGEQSPLPGCGRRDR
ncbi:MAG: hypothetical protein AB1589_31365 [Cyanobacteriota bacterium]